MMEAKGVHASPARQGFTLVEMAIVLVIVGLLVGGVLTGKELMEAARLRKVVTEVSTIKAAYNTFQTNFQALPGDLAKADTWWPTCTSPLGSCNGDGNGVIVAYLSARAEYQLAWMHLSLAQIIPGNYAVDTAAPVIGPNFYPSKWTGAGYMFNGVSTAASISGRNMQGLPGTPNVLTFAAPLSTGGLYLWGGVMDAAQASQIDKKMDDNDAGAGKVRATTGDNTGDAGCVDTPSKYSTPPVSYVISPLVGKCMLHFIFE